MVFVGMGQYVVLNCNHVNDGTFKAKRCQSEFALCLLTDK